jgi:hypothetical protein
MSLTSIEQITKERGRTYGDFGLIGDIAQTIKDTMRVAVGLTGRKWGDLPGYVREALDHDATKTARILIGDPMFLDNWDDKQGYAKIVADRIRAGLGTIEEIPSGWRMVGPDFWQEIGTPRVYNGTLQQLKECLKKD